MLRARQIRKLFESCATDKAIGVHGYKEQLRTALGITENYETGEPRIDRDNRWVGDYVFSPQELAMEFFGRDWKEAISPQSYHHNIAKVQHLQEGGTVVMPSHFSNVSAFNDTIGGLVSAMIIENYTHPKFIGDRMCTTIPAPEPWVDGGRMIGIMNDGNPKQDPTQNLPFNEPYPAVGEKETYVEIPKLERRGNSMEINEATFRFDRTGEVEEKARASAYAIAVNKETRIADTVMGIENTYSRDGKAAHTYQQVAGDLPNNYVNTLTDDLTDYTSINAMFNVLQSNKDPGTNYPIAVDTPTILVSPFEVMRVRTILTATTVRHASSSDLTQIQYSPNPVNVFTPAFELEQSRYWYDRLITKGEDATFSKSRYWFGDFKKAFAYRAYIPMETKTLPLTSEQLLKDIIFHQLTREWGVPFVREPRYVLRQVAANDATKTV